MTHALEKLLTPKNIRIFCTVVECGSMTAAANALGSSQPVVSSLISEIETAIGSSLIDRSRRPLRLTPVGLVVYERSKPLISQLNDLYASIAAIKGGRHQPVAIGMISSLSAGSSALIKRLHDVIGNLRVVTGVTPDLGLHLKNGEVNTILTIDSEHLSSQYCKVGIFVERFVLITPPTREYRVCKSLPEIATRFPFVEYAARSTLGLSINDYLNKASVQRERCVELNTPYQVVRAVSQGMGWALSPPTCVLESGVRTDALDLRPLPRLSRRIVIASVQSDASHLELMNAVSGIVQSHIRTQLAEGFRSANSWVSDLFDFEPTTSLSAAVHSSQ